MWLSGVLSPQEADKSDILLYTLWIHIPNLRRSLDPPGAYINSLRPHLLRFGMWIHIGTDVYRPIRPEGPDTSVLRMVEGR